MELLKLVSALSAMSDEAVVHLRTCNSVDPRTFHGPNVHLQPLSRIWLSQVVTQFLGGLLAGREPGKGNRVPKSNQGETLHPWPNFANQARIISCPARYCIRYHKSRSMYKQLMKQIRNSDGLNFCLRSQDHPEGILNPPYFDSEPTRYCFLLPIMGHANPPPSQPNLDPP